MRSRFVLAGLMAAALLSACTSAPAATAPTSHEPSGPPALDVSVVMDGLSHPWDVAQAPDGTLLVDERSGGLRAVRPDGDVREVQSDFGDLFARGETGLMGLTLDPGFADSRRFYTGQGRTSGAGASVAVVAWTMAADWSAATRVADPLVGGIPVNESSGRHGGCRLRFDAEGALLIGTGDNTRGTNAQDLGSPAGKGLRGGAATRRAAAADPLPPRAGPAGNPFADRRDPDSALIWTYGHRNVQGLAVRPGTGQVFSVEHGPARDDEVNLLRPGANYGWNPDGAGGAYDESVPMTDPDIPGAVPAVWSSGDPTIAPSGATFLDGRQWGSYDGLLLLGVLKGEGVLALRLDPAGALQEQFRLPELEGSYGRIRSVLQGVDGALYVTTDNRADDKLLRVTPR